MLTAFSSPLDKCETLSFPFPFPLHGMLLLLLQVPRCRAATLMAYMHNDHLSSCAWVPLVQLAVRREGAGGGL